MITFDGTVLAGSVKATLDVHFLLVPLLKIDLSRG